jgi:hypothetical protein
MSEQQISEEWDDPISDEERDELLRSLKEFSECEHEWVDPLPGDPMADAFPGLQNCHKCGGAQIPATQKEFEQFAKLVEDADKES